MPHQTQHNATSKQADANALSPSSGGGRQRQRQRTSSMPVENRKPRLADTRRSAIHCADVDLEYYRLRSFSITSHGICNLGDSMRKRRSRSITSVTSTGTAASERGRNNSNASQLSNGGDNCGAGGIVGELFDEEDAAAAEATDDGKDAYKVAILGAGGVGKTALTYQFTTSDYICAYDLSLGVYIYCCQIILDAFTNISQYVVRLDDDYGQKTVSVLLDGQETDLEIIDHPACEMSVRTKQSLYTTQYKFLLRTMFIVVLILYADRGLLFNIQHRSFRDRLFGGRSFDIQSGRANFALFARQ